MNEEERAELDAAQATDRAAAQSILEEVRTKGDFEEYSTQVLENVTHGHPGYSQIALNIINDPQSVGDYFITETGEGLNVIRLDSEKEDVQWLVSQIMVCFEGKSNCQDPIAAVEGSIRINQAADGLTPANFTSRAKEFSTDPSVVDNEGDLSWIQPGLLPSGLELAIRGTEVGGISGVVESEYGYHVFYVREVSPVRSFSVTRHVARLTNANDIAVLGGWINTDLSGKQLKSSAVEFEQTSGEPIVTLNFDGEGGDLFAEMTSRLVGQQIAIFLDGEVISAPVVQQAIYGGTAQVSGNFTVDEAKLLSQRLNAGALPVPIDLLSQQTVGPTLGSASLERSLMAGMIGFILVALFMILYYRLPGILAVLALILYALMNLAAYKLFGITLTLAGIAGFILSVGMAVDANVLIFERMLEELKSGRDLPRAIEEGFLRAWTSIRDGNVTTLIAAGVLFIFSTSFIKGFAVTLTIGVLLSMFSAIVVTRTLLRLVSEWKALRAPVLYGARKKTDV